ncbi:7-cyano-7-deazaguanine reductase [Rivibacter subsaxonicus]|uniref:NADPH-dependent 7-cyano-7-deazaguanine reductase n=2 Tax=Rivibacter subsaxonicus TaxID=457575 RepID=A0A4V2FSB1_9BURK|nr:7-cyano-7-deazaguanine reductase [Rivibacter subsaxonicus]
MATTRPKKKPATETPGRPKFPDSPSGGRTPQRGGLGGAPRQREMPANPPTAPSKELHVFPNPAPERDYVIQFQIPEFTCHCPLTGQPDFAHFTIDMIADELCIELKSLKMYFWSFRNEGAFHEKVTNDILSKIVAVTKPRYARISARWYVRGGIYTNVVAEHRKKGWKPAPRIDLPAHAEERGLLG